MSQVKIYEEGGVAPRHFDAERVFFVNGQTHGTPEKLMSFASSGTTAASVEGTLFVNPDALLAMEVTQ